MVSVSHLANMATICSGMTSNWAGAKELWESHQMVLGLNLAHAFEFHFLGQFALVR
jgi:hypothetical protein